VLQFKLFAGMAMLYSSLKLVSVLGQGEFGIVMKAVAYNIDSSAQSTTVAVKMLRSTSYRLMCYKPTQRIT